MRRNRYWNDILVMPDDLIAFAWSAPMRDLAARLEMSDVGLKKLLISHGIVSPPQGYWNKVRAGKPVPARPKAAERRPGEIGRIRVDSRFAQVLQSVPPIRSSGPFASKHIPEDLEELRRLELHALGRVSVPKSLERPHKGLRPLLSQEERRRKKFAESHWHWDAPIFDSPVAKRRLRILNGIFLALARRGHGGDAYERNAEIHARAIVGDTALGVEVGVQDNRRSTRVGGYNKSAPDLPGSTPLMLKLGPSLEGNTIETWFDDKEGTLETKLAEIVAGIITAAEGLFRRSLREAEELAEQRRIEEEKRRQEEIAALDRERLVNLHKSGELLRQAEEIRSLVARVRDAVADSPNITASELAEWENWALAEADNIDPVRSGQFLTHLRATGSGRERS